MATRLLLGFILFSYFSLCQTEEQRKYAVENFQEFKSFILAPESNEPLLTHFHSKDVYLDLYLDTPEQLLLKNNFSLRFRKRILDATNTNNSYSFQLKNEMDSIHSIRMEVEEKELYFYFAKSDTGWIPLTDLLDTIFYNYENYGANSSNSLHRAITILKSWITFKVNGAIAPFQKLLFLDFKTDEIKTLRPEMYGKSTRYRSHIYAKENSKYSIEKNKVKKDRLPVFFQENGHLNWLLESSLDSTTFYKIVNDKVLSTNVLEYEVENKYYHHQMGSNILYFYENYLMKQFVLTSKKDSKYKQASMQFSKL